MATINLINVSSIYSGQRDKCCCGCSGTHYYTKHNQTWASKDRGYEVTDDEVHDDKVIRLFKKILKKHAEGENLKCLSPICYSMDSGGRTYVIYLNGDTLTEQKK